MNVEYITTPLCSFFVLIIKLIISIILEIKLPSGPIRYDANYDGDVCGLASAAGLKTCNTVMH